MATVYLELSPSFPPLSPAKLIQNSMSASPLPNQQPTSVFKALGSYADRIRDQNGQLIKSPPSSSTPLQTPARSSSMSASNTASASASTKVSTPVTPAEPTGVEVQVDDGPWETVHSTKTKGNKGERDHHAEKGSNSRNWRDRPMREKAGESSREGQGEKKASGSIGASGSKSKKGSSSASASASATRTNGDLAKAQSSAGPSKPAPSTAAPAKPAWGLPSTKASTIATTPSQSNDPIPAAKPTAKTNTPAKASAITPPSPSLNGSTAVSSVSGDTLNEGTNSKLVESVSATPASNPSQKKEPTPSTKETKETKANKKDEPKVETSTPPVPAPRVVAPPTNPWNVVKPTTLASPAIITVAASAMNEAKPSGRIQFGQLSFSDEAANPLPNGTTNGTEEAVKIGGKKKKKDSPAAVVMDANQWPDVAQAQTVGVKHEKKEPKVVEEAQEESTTTKKPKWKAIPAAELLAAADEAAAAAAEAKQRAERKRGKHGESSKSPIDKVSPLSAGGKGRKNEGKRSEIRLPPNPSGQSRTAFKPTFGSVENGLEGEGDLALNRNGHASAPLSRQTSRASKMGSSPSRSTVLPSSTSDSAIPLEQTMRFGSGPLKGHQQNATAPLPQQPFNPATAGNLPRPPRGGRASFSNGRGRGGHRGRNGNFDPTFGGAAAQYTTYGHAGYGQPMYDPMQSQWANIQMYGRGPMPPPPQPQTVVPGLNLDPLRFYVLGQVEYYFSMQNLAMDFFLRQQMDTEGWISIPMIASFNRIKSLTPEVPLVKEMMELSSLLEVQGEHVRIAGEDAKKWVLPDAKPSPFPPSTYISPAMTTPATASVSDTLDETLSIDDSTAVSVAESMSLNPENAFDMVDMGFGTELKYQPDEVKAALMKSGPDKSGEKEVLMDEVTVNGGEGEKVMEEVNGEVKATETA